MGLAPNIEKKKSFFIKKCTRCRQEFGPENFAKTKSIFYPDGFLPICNDCLEAYLRDTGYSWDAIDKLCQYCDLPFVPKEWERIHELAPEDTFNKYAEVFNGQEYEGLGWDDYFKAFLQLKKDKMIEDELPLLDDKKRQHLKERWGPNYDDEALNYLENLFNGLLATQNVAGALQLDQALKLCKMSYEIDSRIRAGEDFDKILSSYEKLTKVANFTPKNAKNANDFDSIGELVRWLEKRGWRASYYDDVPKDIVDETIKNIQGWNQRLYIEESGIGDEITNRIENLKTAKEIENGYYISETNTQDDLDKYENDGFDKLLSDDEDIFVSEVDEDD